MLGAERSLSGCRGLLWTCAVDVHSRFKRCASGAQTPAVRWVCGPLQPRRGSTARPDEVGLSRRRQGGFLSRVSGVCLNGLVEGGAAILGVKLRFNTYRFGACHAAQSRGLNGQRGAAESHPVERRCALSKQVRRREEGGRLPLLLRLAQPII